MPFKSIEDIKSVKFYLGLLNEFLATFVLVALAIGSGSQAPEDKSRLRILKVPFAVGLSVAIAVWNGLHTGGCHVNPAVSFSHLITHEIGILSFFLHSIMEIFGAITAAYMIKFVSPPGFNDMVGAQTLVDGLTWYQGFLIETLTTFLLIFTVLATADPHRPHPGGSGPLMIGISVTLCHFWANPFTGCAMNPARAVSSHLASGIIYHYPYVWIYWVAPFLGSLLASLLYHLVFAGDSSREKLKKYFSNFFVNLL